MKYDYRVKHNGVIYEAGEDVPVECKQSPIVAEVEKPKTSENAKDDKMFAESVKAEKQPKTEGKKKTTK